MKTKKSCIQLKRVNGYDILFVHASSPTIHIEAVVHSGFIYETKKTSGINHLLEHVLVSGWKPCKGSCNNYWDEKGAIINASTDTTEMKYYIKGLISDTNDMVEYISSITHSLFPIKTFNNEKQAVIDELTALSGDPETKLLDTFNKEFFRLDGLKHMEDWKLQIENLKHLTLDDLKREYEAFNTNNILFIVYGKFEVSRLLPLFSKHLVLRKGNEIKKKDCFSHVHTIMHLPFTMEGTSILIGFPSTLKTSPYFECFQTLLHQLLFKEMRTIHNLVYDVEIQCTTNLCGTVLTLQMNVRDINIKSAIVLLMKLLHHYCITEVDDAHIKSCKKTVVYKYHTDYSMMDYYTSFIQSGTPLTKQQLIQKVDTFQASQFKHLCNRLFVFDQITCVYQGSTNAHLSWDHLTSAQRDANF